MSTRPSFALFEFKGSQFFCLYFFAILTILPFSKGIRLQIISVWSWAELSKNWLSLYYFYVSKWKTLNIKWSILNTNVLKLESILPRKLHFVRMQIEQVSWSYISEFINLINYIIGWNSCLTLFNFEKNIDRIKFKKQIPYILNHNCAFFTFLSRKIIEPS